VKGFNGVSSRVCYPKKIRVGRNTTRRLVYACLRSYSPIFACVALRLLASDIPNDFARNYSLA